jgi:hypothetical protein
MRQTVAVNPRALEKLQVTEFFDLNHRVRMRNELPTDNRNMLKSLKITPHRQVVRLEKQDPNL